MESHEIADQLRMLSDHLKEGSFRLDVGSESLKATIEYYSSRAQSLLHDNRELLGLKFGFRTSNGCYVDQICEIVNFKREQLVLTTRFISPTEGGSREVTDPIKVATHLAGYSRWLSELLTRYAQIIEKPTCEIQINQESKSKSVKKSSGGRKPKLSKFELEAISLWLRGRNYESIDSEMINRGGYRGPRPSTGEAKRWKHGDSFLTIKAGKERKAIAQDEKGTWYLKPAQVGSSGQDEMPAA